MSYKCFTDSGIISIVFGILTGIIFSDGSYIEGEYEKNIKNRGVKVQIMRGGIYLFVIYMLIQPFKYLSQIYVLNDPDMAAYYKFFFNQILGGWFFGFGIVYIVPFIFNYFNIDVDGDLLKIKTK